MAHCQCFVDSKALYERLRTWVPKELKYCYRCERFTFRKKSQNWRCMFFLSKLSQSQSKELMSFRFPWPSETPTAVEKVLDAPLKERRIWMENVEEMVY
jgi:hypothetical protein